MIFGLHHFKMANIKRIVSPDSICLKVLWLEGGFLIMALYILYCIPGKLKVILNECSVAEVNQTRVR